MPRKLLAFALALPLFGQGTLSIIGPATVRPGGTLSLSVSLAAVTGASGLQWTLQHSGLTPTWAVGAQGTAAAKDLTCRVQTNTSTCLLVGINANVLQPGEVAKLTVPVPPSTAPGTVALTLSGVIAASSTGAALPVTAGPPLSVSVLFPSDLNSDGKTDAVDLLISVNQIIGVTACGQADIDKSGACDLLDAMLLIQQALKERVP